MTKIDISEFKNHLIKENKMSNDLIDIISSIDPKKPNKKLSAKKKYVNKKVLTITDEDDISEYERYRISNLPKYLDTNKQHNNYDASLYFRCKKLLTYTYLDKNNIIDNVDYVSEPVFVAAIMNWDNDNEDNIQQILESSFNWNNVYYRYVISMFILAHMALCDSTILVSNPNCPTYNFFPTMKDKPEDVNINLTKRMWSCDLYYYSPGINSIDFKYYSKYLDWLKNNNHLSFEARFNKGLDMIIEEDIFKLCDVSLSEYIKSKKWYRNLFNLKKWRK